VHYYKIYPNACVTRAKQPQGCNTVPYLLYGAFRVRNKLLTYSITFTIFRSVIIDIYVYIMLMSMHVPWYCW